MTYEYGVVLRRQRRGQPAVWQFWLGEGCELEHSSFLTVMNRAGARGFEAFAAGNFDELGVPEVILKRAIAPPPPPPAPRAKADATTGSASGARSASAKPAVASGAARRPEAKSQPATKGKGSPRRPKGAS